MPLSLWKIICVTRFSCSHYCAFHFAFNQSSKKIKNNKIKTASRYTSILSSHLNTWTTTCKNNQRSPLSSSLVSSNQWKMRCAPTMLNDQGKGNDNKNRKSSLSNPQKWINPLIFPNLPGEEEAETKEVIRKAIGEVSNHGRNDRDFRISHRDEHSEHVLMEKRCR